MKRFIFLFVRSEDIDIPPHVAEDGFEFVGQGQIVKKFSIPKSVERSRDFVGSMIVHAENMDHAIQRAQSSSHVTFGGEIVVFEVAG